MLPLTALAWTEVAYIAPGDAGANTYHYHHGTLEDSCGSGYDTAFTSLFNWVSETHVSFQSVLYYTYVDYGATTMGVFQISNNSGRYYFNSNYYGAVYDNSLYGYGPIFYPNNATLTYSNQDGALVQMFGFAGRSTSDRCKSPDVQALGRRY